MDEVTYYVWFKLVSEDPQLERDWELWSVETNYSTALLEMKKLMRNRIGQPMSDLAAIAEVRIDQTIVRSKAR